MADTLKRLAKAAITGSVVTIYTVPASTQAIVRNIHINNGNATSETITLVVAGTNFLKDLPLSPKGGFNENYGVVLEAGETITVVGSTTGMTIFISGVEVA